MLQKNPHLESVRAEYIVNKFLNFTSKELRKSAQHKQHYSLGLLITVVTDSMKTVTDVQMMMQLNLTRSDKTARFVLSNKSNGASNKKPSRNYGKATTGWGLGPLL